MAIKKFIDSRIINKHDIEANWNSNPDFIPSQGEIILYDIDENYDFERFKIGDGITNVINLPFVIPTKVSQLENDSNFLSEEEVKNMIEVLPPVSEENEGHILQVINGVATWASIFPNAEEEMF